jgi:ERF superfamily
MKTSENLNELATALSKAQAEFKIAGKDKANPFFKSQYADLESIVEACRPALSKNGLSFVQITKITENGTNLVTRLFHASGQWLEGEYPILTIKDDPQGFGSGLTYARRYALAATLGVVSGDDDDGEKAMSRNEPQKPAFQKKPEIKADPKKEPLKIKNEAPISADQQKALFALAETKGLKPSDVQLLLTAQFQVEKSAMLKVWQFENLIIQLKDVK